MGGVRVELEIEAANPCPVAELTDQTAISADQLTWSGGENEVVEQFATSDTVSSLPDAIDPVFEYDAEGIYEFVRSDDDDCPCRQIEQTGYPIADVRVDDGAMFVTLHLADGTDLSALLTDLRDQFKSVSIRTIARGDTARSKDSDLVPIDRSRLTARQLEVLRTAHAMGYFDYPRQANATEVADELGICPSTLAEHLAAAQSKLLTDLLGGAIADSATSSATPVEAETK